MMLWKAHVEAASKMIGKRNGRMRDFIIIYLFFLFWRVVDFVDRLEVALNFEGVGGTRDCEREGRGQYIYMSIHVYGTIVAI